MADEAVCGHADEPPRQLTKKQQRQAERAAALEAAERLARAAAETRAEEARRAEESADRLRTVLENAMLGSGEDSDASEAEQCDADDVSDRPVAAGAAPNAFAGLLGSDRESDGGSSDGSGEEVSAAGTLRPEAPEPGDSLSMAPPRADSPAGRGKKGRREAAERRKQAAAQRNGGGAKVVEPIASSLGPSAGYSSAPVSGVWAFGNSAVAPPPESQLRPPPPRPPPWPKMALAAILAGSRIDADDGVTLGWVKGYIAAVYFGTSAERAAAGVPAWEDEGGRGAGVRGSEGTEPAQGNGRSSAMAGKRVAVSTGDGAPPLLLGASAAADPAAIRPWNTGGAFRGKFETAIGVRGADTRLSQALAAAIADGDVLPPLKHNRFRPSEAAVAAAAGGGGGAGGGKEAGGQHAGAGAAGAAGGGGGASAVKLSEEERAALRRQYKAQLEERAARREGFT